MTSVEPDVVIRLGARAVASHWVDMIVLRLGLTHLAEREVQEGVDDFALAVGSHPALEHEGVGQHFYRDLGTTAREVARAATENQFQIVAKPAVVMVWSALDAMTTDYVVAVLASTPLSEWPEPFRKTKLPLGDVAGLSAEDLARYVLRLFDANLAGAALLEARLDLVGCGGELAPDLGRQLAEMHQVRNLIVHRNGITDSRLHERCPWLTDRPIGRPFAFTDEVVGRYMAASMSYCSTLAERHVREPPE